MTLLSTMIHRAARWPAGFGNGVLGSDRLQAPPDAVLRVRMRRPWRAGQAASAGEVDGRTFDKDGFELEVAVKHHQIGKSAQLDAATIIEAQHVGLERGEPA